MTAKQIEKAVSDLERSFNRNTDSASLRKSLQDLFDECFLRVLSDNSYKTALDKGFKLLRRLENSAQPKTCYKNKYDASYALEGLCFCAELLSFDTGRSFVFESECNTIYICAQQKQFLLCVANILANALKYSASEDIFITLKAQNNNAIICITDTGDFSCEKFQTAIIKPCSLGFAVRFFEALGGSVALESSSGHTTLALRLPIADEKLPVTAPLSIEELLYDRLSVLYIAFCGH